MTSVSQLHRTTVSVHGRICQRLLYLQVGAIDDNELTDSCDIYDFISHVLSPLSQPSVATAPSALTFHTSRR